jgi:hypothetical protein
MTSPMPIVNVNGLLGVVRESKRMPLGNQPA